MSQLQVSTILKPYKRPLKPLPQRVLRVSGYTALVLISLLYGMIYAVLPPQLLFIPATPVLLLVGLVLWALPDHDVAQTGPIFGLTVAFLASNYIWPSYVALSLPGVPWINPQRLALFLLLGIALYGYATSSRMRSVTAGVVKNTPVIWYAFAVFWVWSLITLPAAGGFVFESTNKWANNQVYWTFLFFITAWLVQKPGTMTTLVKTLVVAAIVTSLISIPEVANKRVPWIDYVPPFLIGDPVIFEKVKSDQARLGLDIYRARSTFTVSITFAEFLSLALPFIIHLTVTAKTQLKTLALCGATLLVMIAMAIFTNARSGMNGLVIGVFGYAAFWTMRRWLMRPNDLIAPAAVLAFPVASIAFVLLTIFWRRLHVMVLGGGQHQFSNAAREVQWQIAAERVMSNPFGYGAGRSAQVIGFTNPDGVLTLDSYYITLLIDYGIVGFVAFATLIIGAIYVALKISLTSDDDEIVLAAPAAIALLAFLVIKSVLSQVENIPIMFMLVGAICALALRSRSRSLAQSEFSDARSVG